MASRLVHAAFYSFMFLSLFLIDCTLGNGFLSLLQRITCKVVCLIRKMVQYSDPNRMVVESSLHVHLVTFVFELVILLATISILKKYKDYRGRSTAKDRIEELLQESRESLRITEEFLDKWRMRKVLTENSYLDDEPQEIPPLKLELPILHMAIINTCGTINRSQPESGDAAMDSLEVCPSDLISLVSIPYEDDENESTSKESLPEQKKVSWEQKMRYLWNVAEEDSAAED